MCNDDERYSSPEVWCAFSIMRMLDNTTTEDASSSPNEPLNDIYSPPEETLKVSSPASSPPVGSSRLEGSPDDNVGTKQQKKRRWFYHQIFKYPNCEDISENELEESKQVREEKKQPILVWKEFVPNSKKRKIARQPYLGAQNHVGII